MTTFGFLFAVEFIKSNPCHQWFTPVNTLKGTRPLEGHMYSCGAPPRRVVWHGG